MILLRATADVLRVVTSAAADIECHVSSVEVDNAAPPVVQDLPRTNTASIVTAVTTTILDCTTANRRRRVLFASLRNNHASVTCDVTVEHTDGTTPETLIKATLLAGEALVYNGVGTWIHYDNNAVPKDRAVTKLYNASTAAQGPGFAADTYATGSFVVFPSAPKVGSKYRCRIDVSKTGAGTATPILIVRTGTAGSTADTARCTFTFNAGTAAADVGTFDIEVVFRAVGSGTTAVLQGRASLTKGATATTGLINLVGQVLQVTSAGFDSTTASLGIGVSVNGGTSAAWTVQLVDAEYDHT